jgi:hypothetical protein
MGVFKISVKFRPFDIRSTRAVGEANIVPNFTHPTIILSPNISYKEIVHVHHPHMCFAMNFAFHLSP